ncbi:Eco57I restriction-modification methylase domain-containing protein [Rhodococcus maanshanensis]|uniref:site-specific DNA-methyltransferase (adenine-specific) n=1 Tax=Rhodococcus maanshanensis TaxID=183556 RepID=A0A1H7PMA1_9NOCA|nr:DNA methyltransferase [Rhodococcus maanshanensis]SEL36554.1 N-6 DNA Methylase [Rhodococcus maanshanensis]
MARQTRRTPTTNAADLHRGWLELVDTEGPFLAIPPLKRVWPNGIPDFRKTHPSRFDVLTDARKWFESAWEALDRSPDSESVLDSYRAARDEWIEIVLRDVAGWSESLSWGDVPGAQAQAQSPNRAVTVTAQAALRGADGIGALVHVVDPVDSLRQTPSDLWAATPVDRLEELLRKSKCDIGVVTDGRWWGLVYASEGSMAASGIVDALTWIEEPRTRDAFLTLIGRQHIIGGELSERLPVLFEESVAAAEEITEALGAQVRRAVELLIQSFSESAADAGRRGLPDPLPTRTHDTYEAAVTVMMRVVFLLFAEERGLLPTGELFEQGYGISRELARLVGRESDESEEALDSTSLTWHRLLATSAALYNGATFENMRMPAYGGSLFDPARFPFLADANEQGSLAITVSDRVMLHVLRSVQIAEIKGEARRISFRDIDVEQIGYIYEGLLGYSAAVAGDVVVGLKGKLGEEPEIPLAVLEALAAEHTDPKKLAAAIRSFTGEDQPSATPQSAAAIAKAIDAEVEPGVVSALTQAVGDNLDLRDRVKPWLGLIRLDLRKHPFVVLAGGLLVKETPSRKNAGAHYTPKSLAEEVVRHTLQPLCYAPGPHESADDQEWKLKSSDELLNLKVADIACGSGAFLVAAARYLAERLVEAWTSEDPGNAVRAGLYNRAMRQVVANCLYGADINDMAVEMCKLSLWLVSLDRDLPFSFVDDKVFLGNSLLGVTRLDQLRRLHVDPAKARSDETFHGQIIDVDAIIQRAIELRRHLLSEIDENDPARTSAAKRRQVGELHRVTADLRKIADGVVAAGLPLGGKPGRALDEAYENLRVAARAAYPDKGASDSTFLDTLVDVGLTPTVETDYERWEPLHWIIEAPDVVIDNGGFDAIVGNPPFLGGQKLTGAMGTPVRDWFVNSIAAGRRGSADLVAYFFLRATSLLQKNGTVGLIATNTVAQGDTREVGLDGMVAGGFTITRAIQSRPWPAASANLEYAAVWGTLAAVPDEVPRVADELPVRRVSTLLEPSGRTEGNPLRLAENAGIGFQGCIVLGMGFVLDAAEAQEWIAADARNAEVLFPYLNGEDLNSRPDASASRWVIDFNDRPEGEASQYALPFRRLVESVKPERQRVKPDGSFVLRRPLPERWWQYGEKRPAMRKAIAALPEVLVIARVSKTVMPLRVPTGQVFHEKVVVFATDFYAVQAVLSSSAHQLWAIKYGTTMRTDPTYTPDLVFGSMPRPETSDRLHIAGRVLEEERRAIMFRRNLGLTKLYNLVNDSSIHRDQDIDRLREIHVEIDEAAMAAYGWDDVPLDHGFHTYRQMERWTVSPAARVEILDRLLEENHRRAAAEAADNRGSLKGRKSKVVSEGQGTLL